MTPGSFHPVAWLAWLAAAALPALSTRNPLYLSLDLLAVSVAYLAIGRRNARAASWGAFVRFSIVLWLLAVPFAALTNHAGRIVLVHLPASWPIVGGPVTLEALLYGLSGGLALVALLLAFATFNIAVDQARLLRLMPGFVYQAGVVAGIAVAFVPQLVASWQEIRDAQRLRGHVVRSVRDLLPLIMPLLVTALERAMLLAESMEARGFGGEVVAEPARRRTLNQAAALAGLGGLGVGLLGATTWPGRQWLAGAILVGGIALLVWSFWDQGRRVRRSRYHRWTWGRADRLVLAAGLIGAAGWTVVLFLNGDWLRYSPFPPFTLLPDFVPWLGLSVVLLATPALLLHPGEPVA